jgi:drug/metabolite transporter (DMT)-like permease
MLAHSAKIERTAMTDLDRRIAKLAPGLFVLLWSTGFVGSKYGSLHAEPFTMTGIRMVLVSALLLIVILLTKAPWPSSRRSFLHLMVAGTLVHATYLCGILYGLRLGVSVGLVAIVAGIQPILTALFARIVLGESLQRWQWLGMALGLIGVLMVVSSKYDIASLSSSNRNGLVAAGVALLGITAGTLYQKRFCADMDLRTGGIVQYLTTTGICVIGAVTFETRQIDWSMQFVAAIVWLAVVLSIGAIGLLYFMIRRGAASQVSSLFFLTPSVTAIMAWLLFGEQLSALAIAGMAATAMGVLLVVKNARSA